MLKWSRPTCRGTKRRICVRVRRMGRVYVEQEESVLKLYITDIQETDQGRYTCVRVTDGQITDDQSVVLEVHSSECTPSPSLQYICAFIMRLLLSRTENIGVRIIILKLLAIFVFSSCSVVRANLNYTTLPFVVRCLHYGPAVAAAIQN